MIRDLSKRIRGNIAPVLVVGFLAAGIGILGWKFFASSARDMTVDVTVPNLSQTASAGETAFNNNCAQCHGENASGSDKGPPLIHNIYNPGHHADGSFFNAVRNGVRGHHWRFGNMPPQRHVSNEDVAAIIRYVREVQAANGITFQPHRM